MADKWNDNKPALTNTIAADIPDIEENFGWIQQVLKMLIGWKTGTIATVSPPGPQRSKFINSTADTHITAEPGVYFHDGTTRQTVFWDTDLVFECGSGGTNALSEDLGASEWHYLYLDDSAIVTLDTNELDNTCLVNNTTAPTWSDVKHGWYNGSDRCIFAFYSDSNSDILEFFHDGGDLVVYADSIEALAATDIDDTWTDVTLSIPGFSTRAEVLFMPSVTTSNASVLYWRTNGQTGSSGHIAGYVSASATRSYVVSDVFTDSSQKIEVKHDASNDNQSAINLEGWYFPTGI